MCVMDGDNSRSPMSVTLFSLSHIIHTISSNKTSRTSKDVPDARYFMKTWHNGNYTCHQLHCYFCRESCFFALVRDDPNNFTAYRGRPLLRKSVIRNWGFSSHGNNEQEVWPKKRLLKVECRTTGVDHIWQSIVASAQVNHGNKIRNRASTPNWLVWRVWWGPARKKHQMWPSPRHTMYPWAQAIILDSAYRSPLSTIS